MRAELAVPVAALLLTAALAPSTGAQTVEDSLEDAAAKGEDLVQDASGDPQGAASNASNASWQGRQVNWTEAWTCQTAQAVDERAGEAAGRVLDCQAPASEQAGEEQDEDEEEEQPEEAQARAEEAEADAEQALRDQVAAVEAFLASTREDPEEAPSHLATLVNRTLVFANRTVAIVERLVELPLLGLERAAQGVQLLAAGLVDATTASAELVAQAGAGVGRAAGEGVAASADGLASASQAGLETLETGWQGLKDALSSEQPEDASPGSGLSPDAEPSAGEGLASEVAGLVAPGV